jgi:hypothetical protein
VTDSDKNSNLLKYKIIKEVKSFIVQAPGIKVCGLVRKLMQVWVSTPVGLRMVPRHLA